MPLRLHRDLRRYNDIESKEEAAEESGWKLVHGDVFRAPPRAGPRGLLVEPPVPAAGASRQPGSLGWPAPVFLTPFFPPCLA